MSEEILVVEYEPRYIERIRQAVAPYPIKPIFARDGDEALKALETARPRLIVLSSIIPKISTGDLIRQMRNRSSAASVPILVTISGYNGKTPKADAVRLGASDLLPKPYSESEFFGKVQEMLGLARGSSGWTSADIGEELDRQLRASASEGKSLAAKKPRRATSEDVDKMLADTLAGVRIPVLRKQSEESGPHSTRPGSQLVDLDKLLEDTLSGLEKRTPAESASRHASQADSNEQELLAEEDTSDGVRFGHYVLLEKIAAGGMAEVWKARMRGVEGFQKIVAIKKILPHLSDNGDFVEMFVDEAKLAAQLNHSNIIHIYDLGRIATSYYIAMEFIDGHDLKSIMLTAEERDLRLPVELALFVASKVASALDYAHRKRDFDEKEMDLVHRDVSPQNVLISYEGDIKLCDFGIAKAASKASHTLAGALKGKLQYMSPEQAWGRHIDRRSDVFALGTVLFELLTGRKLFGGDNELSVLEQVRQARITAPSAINEDVTPEIDAIVMRALQREPESRYQTAGELAKELDAIVYNFWPTPTNADLAIYMHHLYSPDAAPAAEPEPLAEVPAEEPEAVVIPFEAVVAPEPSAAEPEIAAEDEQPVVASGDDSGKAEAEPAAVEEEKEQDEVAAEMFGATRPARRKFGVAAAAVGFLLLAGAAAGSYYVIKGRGTPDAAAVEPARSAVAVRPAPAQGTNLASAGTPPPAAVSTVALDTIDASALDGTEQARVDQEVQRRLEAERVRLENQRALQLVAERQSQQSLPSAAVPAVTQPVVQVTATPAPPPTEVVTTATPGPVVTVPAATPAPVPAVVQAAPPPTPRPLREGDLVDARDPALVPASIIKQYRPPYPPMAKMQKVEGVVIVSALVSETGKVLETRILRGVPQNVGINEAAIDAVRRTTFKPATKDGIRVKAYKNITVPFKL